MKNNENLPSPTMEEMCKRLEKVYDDKVTYVGDEFIIGRDDYEIYTTKKEILWLYYGHECPY